MSVSPPTTNCQPDIMTGSSLREKTWMSEEDVAAASVDTRTTPSPARVKPIWPVPVTVTSSTPRKPRAQPSTLRGVRRSRWKTSAAMSTQKKVFVDSTMEPPTPEACAMP